jgi:hypothetical protein
MKLEDAAGEIRRKADERIQELAQERAAEYQELYDRVLQSGQGKSVEEVKVLLAREWRQALMPEISDSELSEKARLLAEGNRIKVDYIVRR